MQVKEINKLYLLAALVVLGAGGGLLLGWNYLFEPQDAGPGPSESERHARVVTANGDVLAKKAESVEWKPVREGDYLGEKDKIKTLASSTATVEFENGSLLNIKPNSLIVIEQLVENNTRVELVGGKLNAQIERVDQNETFIIKAKSAQAEVFKEAVRVD